MEAYEIQQQFFNYLKSLLPPHLSLVDELCDVLGLSPDSVYRRIRGEKPIALSELKIICDKYHISLDHVLQLQTDSVVFQAPEINNHGSTFEEYLNGIIQRLKYFNSFEKRQMLYLCKDLPFWHFYLFPEIAAFKTFVWIKTVRNDISLGNKKFSLEEYSFDRCYALGQEMIRQYNQMPSTELWNYESINSTTHQIQYYKEAGIFSNPSDLNRVIESFIQALEHIHSQVEKGRKFLPGASELNHKASLKFFVNEVILGNNTIIAEINDNKLSFVNYNTLDYLFTKDGRFSETVFNNFHTLMSRSSQISETGEKERNRFFSKLKDKVFQLKN